MRSWKKRIKTLNRKQARGNQSKQSVMHSLSNLYRFGAGRKGRKYIGNSNKTFDCCTCHPSIKPAHARRKMNKNINKKEIKIALN